MSMPPRRPPLTGPPGENENGESTLVRVLTLAEAASGWLLGDVVLTARILDDGAASAIIEVRGESGSAHIECEVDSSGWLCAEMFAEETMVLRVWAETDEEGVGFWPDGASGNGDPPGRLADDIHALRIDCAAWPELRRKDVLIIPRIAVEE
ncbi:MAG: hypothetical protein HXY28_09265 [Hydrogenophilaceae bacterium]|jgi:hypothetical protein|nr:hypothetical protein [Hydrogenophilaceae bacterium]